PPTNPLSFGTQQNDPHDAVAAQKLKTRQERDDAKKEQQKADRLVVVHEKAVLKHRAVIAAAQLLESIPGALAAMGNQKAIAKAKKFLSDHGILDVEASTNRTAPVVVVPSTSPPLVVASTSPLLVVPPSSPALAPASTTAGTATVSKDVETTATGAQKEPKRGRGRPAKDVPAPLEAQNTAPAPPPESALRGTANVARKALTALQPAPTSTTGSAKATNVLAKGKGKGRVAEKAKDVVAPAKRGRSSENRASTRDELPAKRVRRAPAHLQVQ
ncbi:hypothetical protein P7C70_g9425, partial [Phenoliferia sp. Uapishka_3]